MTIQLQRIKGTPMAQRLTIRGHEWVVDGTAAEGGDDPGTRAPRSGQDPLLTRQEQPRGDRARDLPDALRTEVLEKMRATHAPARWIALVEQPTAMEAEDQQRSLGDSLPPGLVLVG